jgi:hypothetical protein
MKWIETLCFMIFFFTALIGTVVIAITVHVMSHWQDFHELVDEDGLCILNLPTDWSGVWSGPVGYYHFVYNYKNVSTRDAISDVHIYTEPKAYTSTVIIMIVFLIIIIIILKKRISDAIKAKLYDQEHKETEETTEPDKSGPEL